MRACRLPPRLAGGCRAKRETGGAALERDCGALVQRFTDIRCVDDRPPRAGSDCLAIKRFRRAMAFCPAGLR